MVDGDENAFDGIQMQQLQTLFDQRLDNIRVLEKREFYDEIELAMKGDKVYRLALILLSTDRIGSVLQSLFKLSYVTAMLGVKFEAMYRKMGDEVVNNLVTSVIDILLNGRVDPHDVGLFITRLSTDLGGQYSYEEFIRVLGWAMTGKYGPVFKEIRANDIVNWMKAYKRKRISEQVKAGKY